MGEKRRNKSPSKTKVEKHSYKNVLQKQLINLLLVK